MERSVSIRSVWFLTAVVAAVYVAAAAFAAPKTPAVATACPNEQIRSEQGASHLPDCMAFELVSPPEKGNQPAQFIAAFNTSLTPTVSADGQRVLFLSQAALGGTPALFNPTGDAYVATRGADGWTTRSTAPPAQFRDMLGNPVLFNDTLTSWMDFLATPGQLARGRAALYEGMGGGSWAQRSDVLVPLTGTFDRASLPQSVSNYQGASQDLSHVFMRPGGLSTSYVPGDPIPNGFNAQGNVYVFSHGESTASEVALLARDGEGAVWGGTCGAWVGGGEVASTRGGRFQGAVSRDGVLSYISTRPNQAPHNPSDPNQPACAASGNPIRILSREEAPAGVEIDELIPGGPAPADGDDYFEGASADGGVVYLSTSRSLTGGDTDAGSNCSRDIATEGCDIYLYDVAEEEAVQVSAGEAAVGHPTPGAGAFAYQGVTAISGDGSRLYFVALGRLIDEANPEGDEPAVPATGTGTLNLGSNEITEVSTAAGAFAVGQVISGSGVPPGATITEVGSGVIKMSANALGFGPQALLAGEPNLYAYQRSDTGSELAFIGTVSPSEQGSLFGASRSFESAEAVPFRGSSPSEGGDGHVLVFQTRAQLTDADADGDRRDSYRYDSAAEPPTLECVTCRPGAPDSAPFDVSSRFFSASLSHSRAAVANRWVSEDGNTILFGTAEPMTVGDTDGLENPYVWRRTEQGDLIARLPSAPNLAQVLPRQMTVSHDGDAIAFESAARLVPQDTDVADDIYVARVNGGLPQQMAPPGCIGEACQGPPVPAPLYQGPGTGSFTGHGNVVQKKQGKKKCRKKKRRGGKKCGKQKASQGRQDSRNGGRR